MQSSACVTAVPTLGILVKNYSYYYCMNNIAGADDRFYRIYAWMHRASSASIQIQSLSCQFFSLWYWHFRGELL
jgi:hypothetical protein